MSDYFERLGQPRRFSIDEASIEREYLARSRLVHPDHNQADNHEESAALNAAYQTLTDPLRRAEYYLSLLGGPTARDEKGQDQQFLMEMMELREQLEGLNGNADAIAVAENDLNGRLDTISRQVEAKFAAVEAAAKVEPRQLLEIRKLLNAAKTIQSLIRGLFDDGID